MNVTPGSDFQKALKDICPQYADGPVCCDGTQLETLHNQIKPSLALFGRCPACIKNFVNNFCATTCDPNMSLFMTGDLARYNSTTFQITQARIDLRDEYAQDLFDSCKNVQDPSDNAEKVVDLMCNGVQPCTTKDWFAYLGSGNPYVPFPMTYKFFDDHTNGTDGMVPRSGYNYPCNSSDLTYQCSCSDCGTPNVCPPPPSPIPNNFPTTLIMISVGCGGAAIVILLFFAALIAGIIQLLLKPKGYSRIGSGSPRPNSYGTMPEEDNDSPTNSVGSINDDDMSESTQMDGSQCCCYGCFKLGAHFERLIKRAFYLWGKVATTFWPVVIVVGVIVVAALSSGVYRFQVVTNTVELWSAPNSRARTEKNYFDAHFNPFYRTEMIIIKPRNQSIFTRIDIPSVTGGAMFGPALQWDVLNEVSLSQFYLVHFGHHNIEVNFR